MKLTKEDIRKYGTLKEQKVLREEGSDWPTSPDVVETNQPEDYDLDRLYNFIVHSLGADKTLQADPTNAFAGSLMYKTEEAFRNSMGIKFSDYLGSNYSRKFKNYFKKAYIEVFGLEAYKKLISNNK